MKRIATILALWSCCLHCHCAGYPPHCRLRTPPPAHTRAGICRGEQRQYFADGSVGYKQFRTKTPFPCRTSFNLGSRHYFLYFVISCATGGKGKLKWNTPLLQLVPAAAAKCRPEIQKHYTGRPACRKQAGLLR